MVHDTQKPHISKKQDGLNIYAITKTMCLPGYKDNGFMIEHIYLYIYIIYIYISVLRLFALLYCLAFWGDQLFEFYCNPTDLLPHDAESGCGESRNRLITILYPFFFCLLVLYFYIALSRVFFEYVSCKLFGRSFN